MTSGFIYFLYRLLLAAGSPFIILYFLIRSARNPAYLRSMPERLGFLLPSYQQTACGAIWFHAVSVGEVLLMPALLDQIRRRLPEARLFVSTSTLAGRALADTKLAGLADGVFYAPLDYVWIIRRVLRRLKPCCVVIAETEIWPNLFREVKRHGCGLVVINGRISDRETGRYTRLRWFFRHVLRWPDAILVQSEAVARRYRDAGAPRERVQVAGNLKYDFEPGLAPEAVATFLDRLAPHHVFIAASTMPPDEEQVVIRAFQRMLRPGLLMILAPRKPERFDLAARLLEEAGVPYLRRSQLTGASALPLPGALLLDTLGELSGLFARADVVFIGGSIVTWGGHNILEPAVAGKPVVVGRYMQNFQEMADQFRAGGALVEVPGAEDLAAAVAALLDDPIRARGIGESARRCAASQRGATATAAGEIERRWTESAASFPGVVPLWPLARLWQIGAAIHRRLHLPRRLDGCVISVGNLSMGGTGKTPMVRYLAERLPGVGVLTRGYGRQASGILLLGPNDRATVAETGDEAQLYRGLPLAIGASRWMAGRALAARHGTNAFLLDDGFQHAGLARDLDIVLIDALDPFAGGDTFPRGRLREPLAALGRADVLVITRSSRPRRGIEERLREYNRRAPVFYARVIPGAWVEGVSGARLPAPPSEPCAAVCGLGNPASFWNTLAELHLRPAERIAFPDHTVFTEAAIAGILARHGTILTTEKDWVRMPHRRGIYWLDIRLEVDGEAEFIAICRKALAECRPGRQSAGFR